MNLKILDKSTGQKNRGFRNPIRSKSNSIRKTAVQYVPYYTALDKIWTDLSVPLYIVIFRNRKTAVQYVPYYTALDKIWTAFIRT